MEPKLGDWVCQRQVNTFYRVEEVVEKYNIAANQTSDRRFVLMAHSREDAELVCAAVNACQELKAKRDKALQEAAAKRSPPPQQPAWGSTPPKPLPEEAFK